MIGEKQPKHYVTWVVGGGERQEDMYTLWLGVTPHDYLHSNAGHMCYDKGNVKQKKTIDRNVFLCCVSAIFYFSQYFFFRNLFFGTFFTFCFYFV